MVLKRFTQKKLYDFPASVEKKSWRFPYFCQSYRQRKIGTFLWTTLHKIGLETSMRGSDFMFDCVHSWYYECHEINFKWGELYIDSPDWIKNKKAAINLIIKKSRNKCLQYASRTKSWRNQKCPGRTTEISN